MQSANSEVDHQQVRSVAAAVADTRGKHRISAELKRFEQESKFLEEELEHLEKMENASATCKEMFIAVETRPDPLLTETCGPTNPSWDRWFERPQDPSRCGCWIL